MKAYQSFLQSVWKFLSSDNGVIVVVVALFVVVGFFSTADSNIRAEQIAWCLDNGGRQVAIDNEIDCFRLTEVLLESTTYEAQRAECFRAPTQIYIPAPNTNLYFCYTFERVTGEN